MAEIIRNRTIRPSSRLETSKSYKIDTKQISRGDTLVVNIDHESKSFKKIFKFKGPDVALKDSISFRIKDFGTSIEISWSGAQPIGDSLSVGKLRPIPKVEKDKIEFKKPLAKKTLQPDTKTSFEAISDSNTHILILGTMPGDRSILQNEYYAHPGNKFWKLVAKLTNSEIPSTYPEKIKLLKKNKIGLWDVAHKALRKGSLDSAIKQEIPNDLPGFLNKNKKIKVIGFNGAKSEALYDKHFPRDQNIIYFSLPSTSPANTGFSFEKWQMPGRK